MSKFNKETEKSIRIVLSLPIYNALKERCGDYGDISRVVRHLLREWIKRGGTIRQVYEAAEATELLAPSTPLDEDTKFIDKRNDTLEGC